jgi:signal transduction histidine kinase
MSAPPPHTAAGYPGPTGAASVSQPSFQSSFRQVLLINAGATVCFPSITALLLQAQIPHGMLLGWWLLHMLSAGIILADWYARHRGRHQIPPRWQMPVELCVAGFAGCIWGLSALAMPLIDAEARLLLVAVIAGVIGASAPALALVPLAGTTFIIAIALPYALHFLTLGTAIGYGLAALLVGYVMAMVVANRIVHRILVRNWRLIRENSGLYDRIRNAQNELLDVADSSEAFAFCDAEGRLQLWNHRFQALLGLKDEDMQRGAPLAPLLARAGLPADLHGQLARAPIAQSRPVLELPNDHWVRASLRPLPEGGHALTLIDITEQQQQNVRLEELFREVSLARDIALRASQAKSTFLANMSHELRTPLNAIIGFSDIIRRKMFGEHSPRYDEYVEDIHSSGTHLLGVISDILDLARIESNQIVLQEDMVDVAEQVATCIRLAAQQFNRPPGSLLSDLPAALPPLYGDARLLRQIMINLIGNALKFSPDNTPVHVGARLDPDSREISVWVRDHGIGVAPEDHARIFAPFEQASTQFSRSYGGVGLGLSLVRAFALAHQGRISIDSKPGKGTLITVIFPAARTGSAGDAGTAQTI